MSKLYVRLLLHSCLKSSKNSSWVDNDDYYDGDDEEGDDSVSNGHQA